MVANLLIPRTGLKHFFTQTPEMNIPVVANLLIPSTGLKPYTACTCETELIVANLLIPSTGLKRYGARSLVEGRRGR